MDAKTIETLAVSAVRDSIVTSPYLDQYISDNDKEPSWDGHVYIYPLGEKSKSKLIGRVPVQVKGHESSTLFKELITFPVATSDLRNYLNDGGLVFFVVYISLGGAEKKIYYADLPPIKLKSILESAQGQKTKNIELRAFPCDGLKKANIFVNCLEHCKKQKSFAGADLLDLGDLDALKSQQILEGVSISASGFGLDEHSLRRLLLESDVYVYAQMKGSAIPQPLKYRPARLETVEKLNISVTVSGRPFYDFITRIHSKDRVKIEIGGSCSITYSERSGVAQFNYTNSSRLRVLVKDLDFQLAILESGQFELEGMVFPFDPSKVQRSKFDVAQQKEILEYHKKMIHMFELLGVEDEIDLSKLTDCDHREIGRLITALVDGEAVHDLKPELPPILILQVAKFRFLLSFVPVEGSGGSYWIYDFFTMKSKITFENENGQQGTMSRYAVLEPQHYMRITNMRFDDILASFRCLEESDEKYHYANDTLLNLLSAYDICDGSQQILIEKAGELAEWLCEAGRDVLDHRFVSLNRLQVIRREREFAYDEILELLAIVQDDEASKDALIGAYLLLGRKEDAQKYYHDLERVVQEGLKHSPIWHFWGVQ